MERKKKKERSKEIRLKERHEKENRIDSVFRREFAKKIAAKKDGIARG